jgi:uncharacterized protein YqgV (UPF0045/DUF77 family)
MISALPSVVVDIGAVLGILLAAAAVATLPPIRRQWTLRVTNPNRARRREDIGEVVAPMFEHVEQRYDQLDERVTAHMTAEEGDRLQIVAQLAEIAARTPPKPCQQDSTDVRLDHLEQHISAVDVRIDGIIGRQ